MTAHLPRGQFKKYYEKGDCTNEHNHHELFKRRNGDNLNKRITEDIDKSLAVSILSRVKAVIKDIYFLY